MVAVLAVICVIQTLALVFLWVNTRGKQAMGKAVFTESDGKKVFTLEFDNDPDDLHTRKYLYLDVVNKDSEPRS